jgi:chromate transporter
LAGTLRRAGWGGAFAAWAGFTLPSALVMFAFALLAPHLEGPTTDAVLHGLKLVAVAVVAQAVWSMARNLCPDRPRAALALLAAALLLVTTGSFVQIAALLIGAVGGAVLCRDLPAAPGLPAMPVSLRTGGVALASFLILLVTLPLAGAAAPYSLLALTGIFYKAGALVFGGGHVVLPLLRDALVLLAGLPVWLWLGHHPADLGSGSLIQYGFRACRQSAPLSAKKKTRAA